MNAIDRAIKDVERGQHWMARQRLRSYLTTNGYDPKLLALMGRISHEMHDEFDAGRMWLLSSQTGPEVDQAIETFMRQAGNTPKQIAGNLPKVVRLAVVEQYPEMIRERIHRYTLHEAICLRPAEKNEARELGKVVELLLALLFLVVLILGIAIFCVGLTAILRGKFDLVFN
jgi:hypothetical protein